MRHKDVVFVVPTTEIMTGSEPAKLSDRETIFNYSALHINKSRATRSRILVVVSGETLLFDERDQRQMHGICLCV